MKKLLESTCCNHWEMILHLSAPRTLPPFKENPSLGHCRDLADIRTKNRQQFCALLEDSLTGLLALAELISCCSCSATRQSQEPQDKPSAARSFYRRGWWREWRGKEEGLEEDEGEQGDMDAREAVAAASSASSSSPAPWSSWLTLDCKAAGVSHSLGKQLCRNGTQELK